MVLWMIFACTTTTSSVSQTCDLSTPVLTPASALPGATVVASTGPLTESWDTSVAFVGAAASQVVVGRDACEDCDSCRAAAVCNVCGECADCAIECSTCIETVSFAVPDVPAGSTTLTITNLHAASSPVAFTVLEGGADSGEAED